MQFFATQKKKSSAAVFIDFECLLVSAFESNIAREEKIDMNPKCLAFTLNAAINL